MKQTLPFLLSAAVLLAGTSLNCVDFATAPGSLFETIKPLSKLVIESDDSPVHRERADAKVRVLRETAIANPKSVEAQMASGYAIAAMEQIWGHKDPKNYSDGMKFLTNAVELAPKDAEVHLVLALAYTRKDQMKAGLHRKRAIELAVKGSPAALNLEKTTGYFRAS